MTLTWSLIIATLNRRDVLIDSLKFNLKQSRSALQLIIVDASQDWQTTHDAIIKNFSEAIETIELLYIPSDEVSLTRQRNIGLSPGWPSR
jgi:hypothetical protein